MSPINTGVLPQGTLVSVGGYHAAADGGSGDFVVLGQQSASLCNTYSASGANGASGTVGSNQITFSTLITLPTGLVIRELVSGSNTLGTLQIAPGSEIASITTSSGSQTAITLTLPMTGTATVPQTINISIAGSNGGTLLLDSNLVGGGPNCYQKTNYRGEPHEWGAFGDGSTDDTLALQNWLGAYGNVSSLAPATAPTNFGPWHATIPATYLVSQPLFCPANATIEGDENLTNNGATKSHHPRIAFEASNSFSGWSYPYTTSGLAPPPQPFAGTQAVIGAGSYCRLSGIAVIGNNQKTVYGSVATSGNTISIPLSSISGIYPGNAVVAVDTSNTILTQDETTVVSTTCSSSCQVTVSQNMTSSTSDTATFYGPDAVEVLGARLTIDGFSLLDLGHYNLFCGVAKGLGADGVSVKDSSFQDSLLDNIYIPGPCSNVRLIGNIVAGAGRDGILFGATEGSIEGGVIEESNNAGLHLVGASRMSVTGMHIQGNGKSNLGGASSAGIVFEHSHTISLCGNHLEGNGGIDTDSAQVYFVNSSPQYSDNITFCGDVYEVQTFPTNQANVTPLYVYDADSGAVIVNTHFYETAEQPAVSIFSPHAQPILQPLMVPQFTLNQISGLTLLNDPVNPDVKIDVQPGAAVDSTGSTLMQLTQTCLLNLNNTGAQGLDTGGGIQASTTYFVFLISAARAGTTTASPTPSCMASTSLVPTFTASAFNSTGYLLTTTGGTAMGDTTVYNPGQLNGVAAGDAIQTASPDSTIPPGTTIQNFSANTQPTSQPTGSWSAGSTTIQLCGSCSTSGIKLGMAITDSGANSCMASGTYITGISVSLVQLTVSQMPSTCSGGSGTQLSISGARQIVLSGGAGSAEVASLVISTGYYRLVGALYTDSSSKLVKFTQDNDTFYLNQPSNDINTATLGTLAIAFPLKSVPLGLAAESFGRCVASSKVHLFSLGQTPPPPNTFPSVPGFDTQVTTALVPTTETAFPFRAYTDTLGRILAQASQSGTTLYCNTDGWVFHRAQ